MTELARKSFRGLATFGLYNRQSLKCEPCNFFFFVVPWLLRDFEATDLSEEKIKNENMLHG